MSSANPKALCAKIKEAGMKAGVALKPGTPVDDAVFELVPPCTDDDKGPHGALGSRLAALRCMHTPAGRSQCPLWYYRLVSIEYRMKQ
eukprot:4429623-Pyramimonas_sp.AAC.2